MDCFGKASSASERTKQKEAEEKINLKITTAQMKSYAETQTMPTLQYLADEFYTDNEIEYVITKDEEVGSTSKTKITVGDHDVIYTKLIKYPYEFGIDKNYKLASINGTKLAAVTEDQYNELLRRIEALESNQSTNTTTSSDGNPVGTIIAYSVNSVPEGGYLKCEGQSVSRTEYAALFAKIGTTYGSDDSATFKVPDLRGEFLRGTGTNSHENQGNGGEVGEHQDNGLPNITASLNDMYSQTASGAFSKTNGGWHPSGPGQAGSYNGVLSFNAAASNPIYGNSNYVTPTNTSVLYCIKY